MSSDKKQMKAQKGVITPGKLSGKKFVRKIYEQVFFGYWAAFLDEKLLNYVEQTKKRVSKKELHSLQKSWKKELTPKIQKMLDIFLIKFSLAPFSRIYGKDKDYVNIINPVRRLKARKLVDLEAFKEEAMKFLKELSNKFLFKQSENGSIQGIARKLLE